MQGNDISGGFSTHSEIQCPQMVIFVRYIVGLLAAALNYRRNVSLDRRTAENVKERWNGPDLRHCVSLAHVERATGMFWGLFMALNLGPSGRPTSVIRAILDLRPSSSTR